MHILVLYYSSLIISLSETNILLSCSSMAVQAKFVNYCPSQLIASRNVTDRSNTNNMYISTVIESGSGMPVTEAQRNIIPYQTVFDPLSMESDSGVTYNVSVSRKRSRDVSNDFNVFPVSQKSRLSDFGHQNNVFQLQEQPDIDFVIAQYAEKVRMQVEEMEMRQTKMLIAAMSEALSKKLNEKDEQIDGMIKLNLALQERIKSLGVENQLWRNLALSNEEAANSLRNNLEQALAQVTDDGYTNGRRNTAADDAESSCGDNEYAVGNNGGCFESGGEKKRLCKQCEERESAVLLLPCKHMCLCTMCGSSVHICPICKSFSQTSVHVNLC